MTKSKAIFILASLGVIVAAIFVYIGQGSTRARKVNGDSELKARLVGYELFRYKGDELRARVSGQSALLKEPSILICQDDIVGLRMDGKLREQASAKKATIAFAGESLFNQKDSVVDTIELDGDVEFHRAQNQFLTEWLFYSEKTGEASTEKPVRIESSGQFIAAEGGMIYNIRNEALRLRGGVVGSIRTDIMRNTSDRKRSK
jgi:hypothetical protein